MPTLVIKQLQSQMPGITGKRLHPLDLTVTGPEITGMTGPSGCGKSLLLRSIADLDPATGDVMLDGQSRITMSGHDWRSRVAYLATDSAWWSDKVGDHFLSNQPLYVDQLGFTLDVMDWAIERLSSGEKQRLGLARQLNRKPDVLLLDEVTASLDENRSEDVESVITAYCHEHSAAAIWITHDQRQLARISQSIIQITPDGSYLLTSPQALQAS